MNSYLVYGANGYTGQLVIARAVAQGDTPIVAGRREEPVRKLAETHDLPWRCFSLSDSEATRWLEAIEAAIAASRNKPGGGKPPTMPAAAAAGLPIASEASATERVEISSPSFNHSPSKYGLPGSNRCHTESVDHLIVLSTFRTRPVALLVHLTTSTKVPSWSFAPSFITRGSRS